MFSSGKPSINRYDVLKYRSEADIVGHYLHINSFPTLINSPLRNDSHPSFALYPVYTENGVEINYRDFSTGESGTGLGLLCKLWGCSQMAAYKRILDNVSYDTINITKGMKPMEKTSIKEPIEMTSKARKWQDYDIEYWASYGIPLEILKWAEVYPISHKFIKRGDHTSTFTCDKYAYTFIERKEGRVTQKFYQPFNTRGFKWQNSHDKSVLGLWTKLPERGNGVCICSSVKDALCLISNMGIPSICLQGEGYPISNTAALELKRRFNCIYVCLDNDETGLKDAVKLCAQHDFINVVIPLFEGGKDISDYYKCNGRDKFIETFKSLFSEAYYNWYNELPF